MKRRTTFLLALIFCLPILSLAQDSKSRITFENLKHDFGTFKEEQGIQSFDFKFKNDGKAPLIINHVQASCGCTTPEWTREPVAPGASGLIKVSYNPKNRPGVFTKTIQVNSNSENGDVVLTISGQVTPHERTIEEDFPNVIGPLRARTNYLAFPPIKLNEVKKDSIEIVNTSDQPVELSFKTPPPHLKAVFKPAKLAPKQKGFLVVTFDASKINTFGFVMHRIYLNIDGKDDYRNSIAVSTTLEEDFSKLTPEELKNAPVVTFDAQSFDFGDIKQNEKVDHTFNLKNDGKSDLIIRNLKTSCGCTAVSPSKNVVPAGETVPIQVTFDTRGKSGRQNKTITVITNDPKNPTTILRISSNVLTN